MCFNLCFRQAVCAAVSSLLLLACLSSPTLKAYDAEKLKAFDKLEAELKKDPERATKLPAPKNGELAVDLECYFDKKYHFSVYVPKAYDPKLEWPVIFANSPGGNARWYCEAYKDYCDEYGWIIVGATESANENPLARRENNEVMFRDAMLRFNVHAPMCVALGFSGGARLSVDLCFGSKPAWMAGTIQMGAGQGNATPSMNKNAAVYITVGKKDFNFNDCHQWEKMCKGAGLHTVLVEFDGEHTNAPPAMVREAIRWQTETFLKFNPDKSAPTLRLRKAYMEKFIAAGKAAETAGDKVLAYVKYRETVEEAATIPLGDDVKKTIAEIQNKTMKELVKDKDVKKEADAYGELQRMMAWAKGMPETKAGLQNVPAQFETIAKKFPDQPSGKKAVELAKEYKDRAAAAK